MQDKVTLCAASAYEQKYYLNPAFNKLPDQVKDELKILCVLYTEDVGGTISLEYEEDGSLVIETAADEGDLLYDDIGSVLKVKRIRYEKQELFEMLETYYKVVFLGEELD